MARRNLGIVMAIGLSTGTLAGCEVIGQVLSALSQLELLGVIPADGYSDPSSAEYGKVKLSLGGWDDFGVPLMPDGDDVEIVPDDGTDVEVEEKEQVVGADLGSFLLLLDGSGSVEADPTCDGCPTDPSRIRVEAARQLATELGYCSGDWRMSLLEFGADAPSAGMNVSTVIADWTTDDAEVAAAADQLSSWFGTPLWDATWDGLDHLSADFGETWTSSDNAGAALVVVSDGADTESLKSLDQVIAHAQSLGIKVHTVGFGPASDSVDSPNSEAVLGLRRLADETGGYYGYVQSVDDLPQLSKAIAGAACGGYTEVEGTFVEPADSGDTVTGLVRLKSAPGIGVPFTFRAP